MYKHKNEKGICYIIDEKNNLFTTQEVERIFYDTAFALSFEDRDDDLLEILGFNGLYDDEAIYEYAYSEINESCMKGVWWPGREEYTKEYSEQREQEVIKTLEKERGYKLCDIEQIDVDV